MISPTKGFCYIYIYIIYIYNIIPLWAMARGVQKYAEVSKVLFLKGLECRSLCKFGLSLS